MSTKLNQAIDTLRRLPQERQDEWAALIVEAENDGPASYTAGQLATIDDGKADAKAGRFASDEEVRALFDRFRTS